MAGPEQGLSRTLKQHTALGTPDSQLSLHPCRWSRMDSGCLNAALDGGDRKDWATGSYTPKQNFLAAAMKDVEAVADIIDVHRDK